MVNAVLRFIQKRRQNEWACFDNLAFVKDDIERPFFKGADMSMLREMEDAGTCFYEMAHALILLRFLRRMALTVFV